MEMVKGKVENIQYDSLDAVLTHMLKVDRTSRLRQEFKILDPMNIDCVYQHVSDIPGKESLAVQWGAFAVPPPLNNRDFCYLSYTCKHVDPDDADNDAVLLVVASVDDFPLPNYEGSPWNLVRGEVLSSGYVFKQMKGKPKGTLEMYYILQVDPKTVLPAAILNMVVKDQALNCGRMKVHVEEAREVTTMQKNGRSADKFFESLFCRAGEKTPLQADLEGAKSKRYLFLDWVCLSHDLKFHVVFDGGSRSYAVSKKYPKGQIHRITIDIKGADASDVKFVFENTAWVDGCSTYYAVWSSDNAKNHKGESVSERAPQWGENEGGRKKSTKKGGGGGGGRDPGIFGGGRVPK
jgi:hypothetical protein